MINLLTTLSVIAFVPTAEAELRNLGGCSVIVDGNRLSIIGNEAANTIEIAGSERVGSVQVTCEGVSDTFAGIEEVTAEAGDGNDTVNVDNRNGFLAGIAINVFGQGGCDIDTIYQMDSDPALTAAEENIDGGFGEDVLLIVAGLRAQRFNIAPGARANSVEAQVTDIDTGLPLANISGSELEELTVKMGDGNDQANVFQVAGVALNLLGQGGDDTLIETLVPILPSGLGTVSLLDLGSGVDKFSLVGAAFSENYKISSVPDQRIPDPEIRVTDLVTGNVIADVQVQQTEEVMIEAGGGDDCVEVNWDAALMRGLSLIHAELGKGNDTFVANVPPVLTEPPTREAQTARLELDTGPGDDQAAFSHSAGSWFDVFFTADMGPGADTVNAMLLPSPADSIPGPEGLRQLHFNVVTGGNDDFVALQNQTNGQFFNVFLEADLGGGNDTFEAVGGIAPCVHPGRGFDTARVTRNLLPFVSEFEKVEVLD
jgi:hypothetical protein